MLSLFYKSLGDPEFLSFFMSKFKKTLMHLIIIFAYFSKNIKQYKNFFLVQVRDKL